jgi:hypothetical protein
MTAASDTRESEIGPRDDRSVVNGQFLGVTDQELAWCREHDFVPEAKALLEAYAAKTDPTKDRPEANLLLRERTVGLREAIGRASVTIDTLYAYINRNAPRGGEDIPAAETEYGVRMLFGADMARMRSLDTIREQIEGHFGSLDFYRYSLGRVLEPAAIPALYERPYSGRVEMIWVVVTTFETKDQGVATYEHIHYGHIPLVFTNPTSIRPVYHHVQEALGRGGQFCEYVNRQPAERP